MSYLRHLQSNIFDYLAGYLLKEKRQERSPTSDGLGVGGEHKQLDESQAQRRVVVFPYDGGDEEDLAVAGEQ